MMQIIFLTIFFQAKAIEAKNELPNLQYAHEIYKQPKPGRVSILIKNLGSDDWATRCKASDELKEYGSYVEKELKQALESSDLEVKSRALRLLELCTLGIGQPSDGCHLSIFEMLEEKGKDYYLEELSNLYGGKYSEYDAFYSEAADENAARKYIANLKLIGFADASIKPHIKYQQEETRDSKFTKVFPQAYGGD